MVSRCNCAAVCWAVLRWRFISIMRRLLLCQLLNFFFSFFPLCVCERVERADSAGKGERSTWPQLDRGLRSLNARKKTNKRSSPRMLICCQWNAFSAAHRGTFDGSAPWPEVRGNAAVVIQQGEQMIGLRKAWWRGEQTPRREKSGERERRLWDGTREKLWDA